MSLENFDFRRCIQVLTLLLAYFNFHKISFLGFGAFFTKRTVKKNQQIFFCQLGESVRIVEIGTADAEARLGTFKKSVFNETIILLNLRSMAVVGRSVGGWQREQNFWTNTPTT